MTKLECNTPINVSAFWFDRHCETVPKRIEFEGHSYTFVDSGLRYHIKRGANIICLFDLTDGESLFRLRRDNNSAWNLLSISR